MSTPGASPWDARFAADAYLYGTAPSAFLVEALGPPDAPLDALDLGCGEGRNAVFLARLGHRVRAADGSAVGLEKTQRLAAAHGVAVDTERVDVPGWATDRTFGLVIAAFLHLPPEQHAALYALLRRLVRPGGRLLAEWFRPEQRTDGYSSGGPPDASWLVTPEALAAAFPGAAVAAPVVTLAEGTGHIGPAAVVRLDWTAPA